MILKRTLTTQTSAELSESGTSCSTKVARNWGPSWLFLILRIQITFTVSDFPMSFLKDCIVLFSCGKIICRICALSSFELVKMGTDMRN